MEALLQYEGAWKPLDGLRSGFMLDAPGKVDKNGKVTLRYRGRMLHIGIGWAIGRTGHSTG